MSEPTAKPRHPGWGRRLRRLGLAWQNALEIMRAGRLTSPYGAPFETVHDSPTYRLRRYARAPEAGVEPILQPLILVPPLMVASEVYDIAPDVSAVAFLARAGVDVWITDFGAPERQAGAMQRTLDDHVRAVADAIARVHAATGQAVHVAGYSQGGMFALQAAALPRSKAVASIITFGAPIDLHRSVPKLSDQIAEKIIDGLRAAIEVPLGRIESLPSFITATGFKLVAAKKEVAQMLEFLRKLHDRQELEKREAKRLFLKGDGFVAWPGPALRQFVDEMIVANRMVQGGFVIDGEVATLADLTVPILYFCGDRDEVASPPSVRAIRRACNRVEEMYEVGVKAGHFGLVVGSTALSVSWPSVVAWMRWREGKAGVPERAVRIPRERGRDSTRQPTPGSRPVEDGEAAAVEVEQVDESADSDLALAQDLVGTLAQMAWQRIGGAGTRFGDYLDNLRWQVPRLATLRRLGDETRISLGRSLADQAERIPDRTFFLWHGRAFTYADANRRVDAVVKGLISCGIRPGQRVGVMMRSRPSHLTATTALSRLGAIAVLLSPETPDAVLPRGLEVGEVESTIVDPENAARVALVFSGKLLVLGGAGELGVAGPRSIPAGAIDMEAIDPEAVALPAWYRANAGRARDLAMVFVTSGRHDAPRANRITNRRWAFSALGAAATCTLSSRDTVYCCLPLHHPAGTLVAAGSALVGGARLALATGFSPSTFWDEVRRYGATVVYYAGEMCRQLVDEPSMIGERNNPVRLFAGSGMRRDVWQRVLDRFGSGVLEFYASTEASAVLANASGEKVGALGRPLPGSPELVVAAYDFDADDFIRDGDGHLARARSGEAGMLIARLDSERGVADAGHIAPARLLHDAFSPGDTWFVTGDILRVDPDGDFWFVDRHAEMIHTAGGVVPSQRIEDALYQAAGVTLAVAVGLPDGELEKPVAAIVATAIDVSALHDAMRGLLPNARPRVIKLVDELPLTDGHRPIKAPVVALDYSTGPRFELADDGESYRRVDE